MRFPLSFRTRRQDGPLSYSPLSEGHIRILTLYSGGTNDDLKCSVDVHPLEAAPTYNAVSYVWGTQSPSYNVICNGHDKAVGFNLYWGLRRIRRKHSSQKLWIDAICINQSNDAERARQVRVMMQIFQRAKTVLIWLGPDSGDLGDKVFPLPQQIADIAREEISARHPGQNYVPGKHYPGLQKLSIEEFIGKGLPQPRAGIWDSVRMFTKLPWFERTWIIQEAAAATSNGRVFFGDREISWSTIGIALEWLRCKFVDHLVGGAANKSMNDAYVIWRLGRKVIFDHDPEPLYYILSRGRAGKCSNPLDKVYAVLGVTLEGSKVEQDEDLAILKPDYTRSIVSLYTGVARMIINYRHGKDSIDADRTAWLWLYRGKFDPTWPSWVPRWHEYSRGSLAGNTEDAISGYYGIKREAHACHLRDSGSDQTLIIEGMTFDVLDKINPLLRAQSSDGLWQLWVEYCLRTKNSRPVAGSDTNRVALRFALALTGWTSYLHSDPRIAGCAEQMMPDFLAWYSEAGGYDMATLLSEGVTEQQIQSNSLQVSTTPSPGRTKRSKSSRFWLTAAKRHEPSFFTSKGHIGLAGNSPQTGDVVCILSGCDIPVLLRPQDDDATGKQYYVMLGLCHVPALLKDPAIRSTEGEIEMGKQWFEIR